MTNQRLSLNEARIAMGVDPVHENSRQRLARLLIRVARWLLTH